VTPQQHPGAVAGPTSANRQLSRRRILRLGLTGASAAALSACGLRGQGGELTADAAGLPPSTTTPVPPIAVPPVPTTSTPVDPQAVATANLGRVPAEWGLDVTGVHNQLADSGRPDAPTLALTFDACGGPGGSGVDAALLDLLESEAVPATLFLNQRWMKQHQALTGRLMGNPLFEIGNHGSRHLPLSVTGQSAYGIPGTIDPPDAVAEVWSNHEVLTDMLGEPPRWFRSGTAHYDEVATSIAVALGERPVGFTTNGDLGATASADQVAAALINAPAGGIVLAHMNQPGGGTAAGVAMALPVLRAAGCRLVTLTDGGGTQP
jgi:peptidoglycan/xylan/chitin deacetylase (PgdA/CDA1 family)